MKPIEAMDRALALAAEQLGRTAPNPSVGCVIVDSHGRIVGQGATGDGGRPHAEEIALAEAGQRARGATAHVTLEPCNSRSGGGPSCTDLLIEAGVARVEIACRDPHPHASGGGMWRLLQAGVTIEVGVMGEVAEALNAGFFSVVRRGVPLVEISRDPLHFDAVWPGLGGLEVSQCLRQLAGEGLTRLCIAPDHEDIPALRAAGVLTPE